MAGEVWAKTDSLRGVANDLDGQTDRIDQVNFTLTANEAPYESQLNMNDQYLQAFAYGQPGQPGYLGAALNVHDTLTSLVTDLRDYSGNVRDAATQLDEVENSSAAGFTVQ